MSREETDGKARSGGLLDQIGRVLSSPAADENRDKTALVGPMAVRMAVDTLQSLQTDPAQQRLAADLVLAMERLCLRQLQDNAEFRSLRLEGLQALLKDEEAQAMLRDTLAEVGEQQ